jgi:hypothetical protein
MRTRAGSEQWRRCPKGSGSPALCRDDFVVGSLAGADAVGRFFAGFDIEILRSVSRRRAALPKPHLAMQPAGQDLGAPLAPEINGQHRSNGARMPVLSGQCCCSRWRHLIAELPR